MNTNQLTTGWASKNWASKKMGNEMKRFGLPLARTAMVGIFAALAGFGCNSSNDLVDRVQTNLVDKSLFEGEWWYTQTAIGMDGDEAQITGLFDNYPASDLALDTHEDWAFSMPLGRIRWVIDQDVLFAYRAFELIDGGNDDGRDPGFRGQPLAAFRIEGHIDVRQEYNSVTGELTNVRVENSSDRRWYERRFMRVDWSQNLVSMPFWGNGSFESTSFFFQDGAHEEFPASYRPQFVRAAEDPDYRFADEWAGEPDAVHYMSFVTQAMYTPGTACNLFVGGGPGPCTSATVTMRNAFLRVPPNHDYAAEELSHREHDRFGIIRTAQRTYVRGGTPLETTNQFCEADGDCGVGGACDVERRICVGGLTDDHGETDFLTFYRSRHNFWTNSLTDTACRVDWECSGVFEGVEGNVGSTCDPAARRCTRPLKDRTTRQVAYHLNAGFPAWLAPAAFETMGIWNEAFMRGWRGVQGLELPTGPDQACQENDPTGYCYCGSPDEVDGMCPWRYDPFQSPADALAAEVTNPYQCHVVNNSGFVAPLSPQSYDDYPAPAAYDYEFVGDDCLFVLKPNSCDVDPSASCEELGDIRYQFFNYITHGNVYFGGVATPLIDPTTGEFIYSSINMAAQSVESVGTTARDFFPVLREEPGANDRYFEGETVRDYYSNRGNTDVPVSAIAESAHDGFSLDDDGRPGLPVDMAEHLHDALRGRLEHIERLKGTDGRTQIMSDRMRNLAGTSVERRLMGSLGPNGLDAAYTSLDPGEHTVGLDALSEEVLDQTSPFRGGFDRLKPETPYDRMVRLAPKGMFIDPPYAPDIESPRLVYWARQFAEFSIEEATIRMQQAYMRGVMLHEAGHGNGLFHNFGASFDRNNYNDAYHRQVFRDDQALAIPRLVDFDLDGDTSVSGPEADAYQAALRAVRDIRNERGIAAHTSSSVMDYHGEFSRVLPDLGRYDVAAALFSHFDLVEAMQPTYDATGADPTGVRPRHDGGSSLAGILLQGERTWWSSYRGGESCEVDTQCPSNGARLISQPVTQRCIKNPRVARLPQPCAGDENCVCSSLDEDFLDFAAGLGYDSDLTGPDGVPDRVADYFPVPYLFCSDFRTDDLSWCSRGDAGESFLEAIDDYRRNWEASYPLSYYRRLRRSGPAMGASWGAISDAVKIYQHLFFRVFNEPGFRTDTGPLGLDNQYFASIEAMNWLAQIVTMPQDGSYALDRSAQVYRRLGDAMDMPGSDVNLPVGMGYPMWSQYQEGLNGFFRVERSGVFYDKYFALLGLAIRDWGLSFSIDERYYINFFDLFPVEMTELFGGMVIDNPRWFAPRVEMAGGEPTITPLTWFRNSCTRGGVNVPCRGSQDDVYPAPALEGTSNEVLRDWATILSLAQFPVFYDASFEQRLAVFKLGSGEGFELPATQAGGRTTCAYDVRLDPGHDTGCEDPDYAVYESDRLHQSFVAVKVRSRLNYNLDEEMLGYQLLTKVIDQQEELRTLRAVASPTAAQLARIAVLEQEVTRTESFLDYLIDIQRRYGISAYFL